MSETKMLFIDTETTGLFENRHHIWELGCILDVDGKQKDKFHMKARPPKGAPIVTEALHACGKTVEEICNYKNTQVDLKEMFEEWLSQWVDKFDRDDKMFFIGYNASFDYNFCRALWKNHDDNYFGSFFWFPYLDVMTIAAWALIDKRGLLANFKMQTVAKAMGFEVKDDMYHGAMFDARMARRIYYKLEG
jgi:DNA polymerase-3 subunit epsilon